MNADTKPCIICGSTITRTNQGATAWTLRAYCSRACIWAGRKAEARDGEASRTCSRCGKPMARPAGLSDAKWRRRTTCSHDCRFLIAAPKKGRCEVCRRALPAARKTKLPWCSKPCKATWQAAHPKEVRASRAQRVATENADPPVRFRSEVLPDGAPRETWIQRQPGSIAVCCGHCRRRFPRATVRLAERLLTMHRRTCGSGL